MSQPTLSAQIRELEAELGVPLFSRTTRQVHLTTEGQRFLERIKELLSSLEAAVTEVREQAVLKQGRITIAATPSLSTSVLPSLMAEFARNYPDIDVRLLEEVSEAVNSLVRNGTADFGLGPMLARQSDLSFTHLFEERFFALVLAEHPLSTASVLPCAALPEWELITVAKGTGIRDVVDRALRDNGLDIGTSHALTRVDTVVALVDAGLGIALLPELSIVGTDPQRIRIVPVAEPEITRSIGLIERKGGSSSSASDAFLKMVRAGHLIDRLFER